MRKSLIPGGVCQAASFALVLSLLGCASNPRPGTGTPAAAGEETPADNSAKPAASVPGVPAASETETIPQFDGALEPPDGKWLRDEEGREYFAAEVPRVEGQYKWEGEGNKQVRLAYGLIFDVLSYDDSSFVIKVYRPVERVRRPARVEADPEAVAATYRSSLAEADRLAFVPFGNGLPAEGQWRHGFDMVDMDGDGQLDIVHGPARKAGSRPVIFLGDGKGGWKRWAAARFPQVAFDYGDAASADLDGDGDFDLVLGNHLKGVAALVNDGKGTFTMWNQGIEFQASPDPDAPAPAFSSREVEIADWNRDGRPDIIALGEGPRMTPSRGPADANFRSGSRGFVIYLNRGDGTWTKTGGPQSDDAVFGDDLALGDVNGDGITDLFTGSSVMGLRSALHLGREDGTWQTVVVDPLRPNAIFRGAGLGDFDGDGRLDIAVGYLNFEALVWRTGVDALLQRDGSWERRPLAHEEGKDGMYGLAVGDVDGDRALDIVALTGAGKSLVFLGDGKGGFTREESSDLGHPGCSGYHVELVDLDGDGAAEVVAGFGGEGSELLGPELCPSGGSLRAWKAVPGKGAKRAK
ncbi:MAG TPA: VCBS repeat-containing protein [Thermoanaerobaculia bacterium]|nr:VCBS repeat-containing protein [Thermoanaerobaculia bacterium]